MPEHTRIHRAAKRFRARSREVKAMQFDGSSERGRDIVSWVFLRGGLAAWTESKPAVGDGGTEGRPAEPGCLQVNETLFGLSDVGRGSWVVLSDGKFSVYSDHDFTEQFVAADE